MTGLEMNHVPVLLACVCAWMYVYMHPCLSVLLPLWGGCARLHSAATPSHDGGDPNEGQGFQAGKALFEKFSHSIENGNQFHCSE